MWTKAYLQHYSLSAADRVRVARPELVGVPGQQAEAVIKKGNPLVDTIEKRTSPIIVPVKCCNRVILFLDSIPNGKVIKVAMVG